MRSFCLIQNLGQAWQRNTHLSIVVLAALMALGSEADARGDRSEQPVESIDSRTAGEPVMAIVSLREQRITVYDANGWILRSPVSSGSKGRETPAGIFSILQKNAERKVGQDWLSLDLIQGKGTGLFILLHGVPGVGKTATATTYNNSFSA